METCVLQMDFSCDRRRPCSPPCWCVVGAAQTRGLVPADFYKEVTVEEVAMRPQGDMVAFTVMTIVEKENTRHREIRLQPLQNGKALGAAFRFTSPTENSGQPRWSPDGALLAFTSNATRTRTRHGLRV